MLPLTMHLLREEALKRKRRLRPRELRSGALKVLRLHIHSVSQPPPARHYSLPRFQPGTRPAQISAAWSLCREAVVSSFIGNCLPSSWFPCSSSVRAADSSLRVRHSLWGRDSLQAPGTPLLCCPGTPTPLCPNNSSSARGEARVQKGRQRKQYCP